MVRQVLLSDQDVLVELSVSVCCRHNETFPMSKSQRHADHLHGEALRDIAPLDRKVM